MYFAQELGKAPGRRSIQVERMFELRDRAGKQAPVGDWNIDVAAAWGCKARRGR